MNAAPILVTATATLALLSTPARGAGQDNGKTEAKVQIFASPRHVFVGQPFMLNWSSTSVTNCMASGDWSGQEPLSGSQTVIPEAAGRLNYSLLCIDPTSDRRVRGSARVSVETPSLSLTETFSPNSVTISTSEGAPYGDCNFWVEGAADCTHESNLGYGPTKVVRTYICLSGEVSTSACSQQPAVTGPLSSDMLGKIDAGIAAFAGTGIRLVIRFTYNFGPIGPGAMDAPIDLIATHIDQLAPILLRHKDLIFALEAGFIGTWGEWHDSTNGNDTAGAQKIVLNKELSYFQGLFPILVRYPGDLIQFTGGAVPVPGLGLHDDFYASNSVDGATWNTCDRGAGYCLSGYTSDELKAFAAQVSTKTMFAGEFGALDTNLQTCSALDEYSFTLHPQSISIFPFPKDIGSFLQSEGCATAFYNRIGTRIELQNLNIIGSATPGGRLYVAATMVNAGYGRVIRRRPVTLILLQNGEVVEKIKLRTDQIDLRTLASSANPVPSTFGFQFVLPEKLLPGPISIGLFIHDPAPSLSLQPAYALPLNSLDENNKPIFDPVTGFNQIATVDIN
jgi:hypothetical protein